MELLILGHFVGTSCMLAVLAHIISKGNRDNLRYKLDIINKINSLENNVRKSVESTGTEEYITTTGRYKPIKPKNREEI